MKRLLTRFLLMTMLFMGVTTVWAQKSVLDESFASGLPTGWTAGPFWKFEDGNAQFAAMVENGADTLSTPLLSLSELTNKPSVAITYSNAAYNGKVNSLKVLYRASEDAEWSELIAFNEGTEGQAQWKGELPEGLQNVQIALAGAYLLGGETRVYRLAVENKTEAANAPTGLKTEELTTNSVDLYWDVCASPMFRQYNIKVNTSKMTDMSAEADIVDMVNWGHTDEFIQLTDLTPNTEYWLYVQYDCGDGDVSPWAEFSFRTPCSSISAPYAENFEGEVSTCYTIINGGSVAAVSGEFAYYSQKSFKSNSGKGKYNYFILPEFNGDVKNFQVSFAAAAIDGGNTYARTVTVGVCTDATAETFTEVKTLDLPKGRVWEQIVVTLKAYAGAGKYIAFRFGNEDAENRLFIDDIKIENASECPKPMFVEVSEITSNSAKLSWVETGNATEWNLVLSTKPLADPEDIEPDAAKGEYAGSISARPYVAAGLKANMKYYAYLQAGCGSSEWTKGIEFTTAKEVAYPYHEAFDRMPAENYTDKVGAIPDGWVVDSRWNNTNATNYDNYSSSYLPYVMTTQNHAQSAYVNASLKLSGTSISSPTSTTGGYTSIAMLPAMPKDIKTMQITFWAMTTSGACDIKIGVAQTQTADLAKGEQLGKNITEVATVSISTKDVWTKFAANLSAYAGTGRYITLYLKPGTSTPTVYIDDITVEDISCGELCAISAEAVNTSSARASWDDISSSSTSWKVKVSSTEIDPTTQNGDIANTTVSEKIYTAEGLTQNTTYYFYISPACTDKWEMVEATTLKLTGTDIPYYNDFTNETSGYGSSTNPVRGPKDWKLGYTYADTYSYSTTSAPYVIATGWDNAPYGVEKNSLYLYNTATASTQFPYAIMPPVTNDGGIKDLQMSFYAYTTLTTNLGTAADPFVSQFKIGVVESINDVNKANGLTKITEVATIKIKASKQPQLFVVDLSGYTGEGKCIVFYNDKVGTAAKACTNYIDNLSINLKSANAPLPVSDLAVSDITTSTAKLTWTKNGNETQWEALVFNGAQDEPEDGDPVWSGTVNEESAAVTGLAVSTSKYYAYVRSVQSNGKGSWTATSFYTACGPMALPFYEDFNGYATGNTSTNTWYPCYSVAHSSASSWPYVRLYTGASQYHPSQSNLLSMEAATGKVCQLEFPEMSASVNTLQMELEASGYSSYVGAKYITFFGVVDAAGTFHEIAQRTNSAQKTWEPWLVDFSSYDIATYGDGKIAIRLDPTRAAEVSGTAATKQYVFIENVKISAIPVCKQIQPDDIEFTEVGPDSMTISWPAAEASKWNLKVSTSILEDPATATADIFDGAIETTPTKKFTGIEDNTWYYVYVQTVRPDQECVGDWSRYAKKKTLCFPRQFPYEENFDSYETTGAGNLPDCSNICGEDAEHSYISTKNSNKMLYLREVTKDHKNYFVFPALNSEDVRKLQLSMQVYTGGTTAGTIYRYQVGIMTDPNDPSTFVELHSEEFECSANVFDRVYKFDKYAGDETGTKFGGYVALTATNGTLKNGNATTSSFYIDNVTIDLISTCVAPNDLAIDSVGTNGAKAIWKTDDKTAAHRVRIFTKEDAKPNTDAFVAEAVVNDSVAIIEGLNGNTVYYAFVRKECDAEDLSKWSSACKFITECEAAQALPYEEGFEGRPLESITARPMPACWTNLTLQGCGDYPSYYSTSAKKDGEFGLYLQTTEVDEHAGSCVGKQRSAVVTPAFDVENLSELLVYFDTKAVSAQYKGSIKIEAVSDETSAAEAIYITTIDNISNKEWSKGYVRIGDYYTSAKPYKRLRFTPSGETSVYIDNMVFTKDVNIIFPVDNLKLEMLTENSVKFSFNENTPIVKQWQVAYVAAGGDIADATLKTIDETEYTIEGLAANTSYDIYVRGNVDGDAWVGPLTATTLQTPAALPYSTGFEDDANLWNLYTVQTVQGGFYPNFFIVGDAANCGGTGDKALFVTNDSANWQSWGNHLPDGDIATSYTWATRNINIPSAGTYKFSFKVKSPVAYSSHGAWAQLFPAGATIKGEIATLLNGTTRSGRATSSAPDNNCYVVMSQQFNVSDWIWYTASIDVKEAGVYTLGIYWYNTAAGTKKETPVAVDSVMVEEYLCTVPSGIEFTNRAAEEVSLKWFAGKCKNFEYVVSQYKKLGNPAGIDAKDKVASGTLTEGPQVTISNLMPTTDYSFYVRTLCPDAETDWVEFDFNTPCELETLPYTEGFYETPECWILSGATVGTGSSDYEVWSRLSLADGGYAILPEFNVPLNKMEIEIGLFNTTANYGAVSLGVMDNTYDKDTYKEIAFFQTVTKPGNEGTYIPTQLEVFSKMLNLYQGTGKVLAIKNATAKSIGVKYITLNELPDCVKPQQIELTYLTENAVTVNWLAGLEEAWEIKINDSIIENVTTNPYRVEGLEQGTLYEVSVRALCDAEHASEWSLPTKFQTNCGVNPLPMFEDFSSLPIPVGTTDLRKAQLLCWENMVSEFNIDQVFAGKDKPIVPSGNVYVGDFWVSNWLKVLGDYAQLHSYRRSSPTYRHKWFVSPQYAIEGNATLSFDIRSTNNAGNAPAPSSDRTVVAISTDNGATWKKEDATVIEDIDFVYTTKSVSLNKYNGQTIRIAFYDENIASSTKIGETPFITIDNVRMNCTDEYPFEDNACQGNDYEGHGFSIKAEDLPVAGESKEYKRFAANTEAGCDSTVVLTLTTYAAEKDTIYASICQGEVYEFGPNKLDKPSSENPGGQPYYLMGETEHGCDYIIYLYLTVNPSDTTKVEKTVLHDESFVIDEFFTLPAETAIGATVDSIVKKEGCSFNHYIITLACHNDTIDIPVSIYVKDLPYEVDAIYTVPAETPVGSTVVVLPNGQDCSYNRYLVEVKDNPTGLIEVSDAMSSIEVYDALGRKVVVLRQGDASFQLPYGVYMLRTVMTNGAIVNSKVTIQ